MCAKQLILAASVMLFLFATSPASALLIQLGEKTTQGGANTLEGTSVAMSANGTTAIVGAPGVVATQGLAWVYTRGSGLAWTPPKKLSDATAPTANQGVSVALSEDGSTAIVGGDYQDGAAWIYTRSGGIWSAPYKLAGGQTHAPPSAQGHSVSISADGNTAVVGGPSDNGNAGAAWVYVRSGVVWAQQGPRLVGSFPDGKAQQGFSVSVSGDGNTIAVGGPEDESGLGAVWVYKRDTSTLVWRQQGQKLVPDQPVVGSVDVTFGTSVSMSADGNTLVVGGPGDNSAAGAAWVYAPNSSGVWDAQGPKLVGTGAVDGPDGARQGYSVSVSADGNTILVGGHHDVTDKGASWVYTRSGSVWSQQGDKLVGTVAVDPAKQGSSVSLSKDGTLAIVGGPEDDTNKGAAWFFVNPAPKIVTVQDVPNDQGGHVSVRWNRSGLDNVPSDPILQYFVWRQVTINAALQALARGATLVSEGTRAVAPTGRTIRTTRNGALDLFWELLDPQPAHGFSGYSYTAPTTSDYISPSNNPITLFMVEAQREPAVDEIFYQSDPVGGYSIDNLPPGSPAQILATYSGGATNIHWSANVEADFATYRLYRGATVGFVPSSVNLVVAKPDTGYSDVGPPGRYYQLCAEDVHDNMSSLALIAPPSLLSVDDGGSVAFALDAVRPNPTRGTGLTVAFALPTSGSARLELLDLSGRCVVSREVGALGAGRHTVNLTAERKVTPGLYWVRLVQGSNERKTRVAVIQ